MDIRWTRYPTDTSNSYPYQLLGHSHVQCTETYLENLSRENEIIHHITMDRRWIYWFLETPTKNMYSDLLDSNLEIGPHYLACLNPKKDMDSIPLMWNGISLGDDNIGWIYLVLGFDYGEWKVYIRDPNDFYLPNWLKCHVDSEDLDALGILHKWTTLTWYLSWHQLLLSSWYCWLYLTSVDCYYR